MRHDESKLQAACVRILKYRYSHLLGCWNHSPNEGKRSDFQGAVLRDMGMTKGWPDLEIACNGKMYFVEFKTAKGRQSPEQKKVQEALESQGHTYVIIRTLESFIDFCHANLGKEIDPDRETLKAILSKQS